MTWPLIPRDQWNVMSTAERLVALAQRSLDECLEILEEPIDYDNAVLMNAKVQVTRAILHTLTRLGVEASRASGERERILGEMARSLRERQLLNGRTE
jgi:hypothetical protein